MFFFQFFRKFFIFVQFWLGGAAPQTSWFLAKGAKLPQTYPLIGLAGGTAAPRTARVLFFPSDDTGAADDTGDADDRASHFSGAQHNCRLSIACQFVTSDNDVDDDDIDDDDVDDDGDNEATSATETTKTTSRQ